MPKPVNAQQLAQAIDSTLLKPTATQGDVLDLCEEAVELGVKAVCVSPIWVPTAAAGLKESDIAICTVIGFPSGAHATGAKAAEAALATDQGATEVDMVINQGAAKGGDTTALEMEVAAVRAASGSATLKVILETAALTDDEIDLAAKAALISGADFLKTSTGFGPGGATAEAVARLAGHAHGQGRSVKASGGIRDTEIALAMLDAGADRLGTSSARAIISGFTS